MNRNETPRCTKCGSTDVRWSENAHGMYLVNVATWTGSQTGAQRRYSRGPHFFTCNRSLMTDRRNSRIELASRIIARYTKAVIVPLVMSGDSSTAAARMTSAADWKDKFIER